MRVFLGIDLSPDCRRAISDAIAPLKAMRAPLSWTPERNLHVTLKFLGEISGSEAERVAAALDGAAAGVPAFELVAEGAGAFPTPKEPRVLWVGIREPLELVGKLQQNMEDALFGAGFPREGKPFHPHITVARARGGLPPGRGTEFVRALSGKRYGVVGVDSYRMYESRLSPGGATYVALRDFPLGGRRNEPRGEEKEA